MTRILTVGAAQLGPIARDESRESVVDRMLALLHSAHEQGVELVVYPELALTTFFPRWWVDDLRTVDHYYETEMPGPATRPLSSSSVVSVKPLLSMTSVRPSHRPTDCPSSSGPATSLCSTFISTTRSNRFHS